MKQFLVDSPTQEGLPTQELDGDEHVMKLLTPNKASYPGLHTSTHVVVDPTVVQPVKMPEAIVGTGGQLGCAAYREGKSGRGGEGVCGALIFF